MMTAANKNVSLLEALRGREVPGGWGAHHLDSNGSAVLSNCQSLCQACHKATWSYGR